MPLELDIGDEGQLSGNWIYDGSTIIIEAGTYDFGGGIYPYPDEEIASNFYIAERPGVIEIDSDREVTYVFGYDDPDDPGDGDETEGDDPDNSDDSDDPDGSSDGSDGDQRDGSKGDASSDESSGSDGKIC